MNNYDRQILALKDDELEKFVRRWALNKTTSYHKVEKFSGAGDRGRDVVGFASSNLHEGEWDNYQCKQYGKTLPTDTAFHEIGKIFYYASIGEFTPPRAFKFVAPRGINRNLQKVFFKPAEFKEALISNWEKYCENTIVVGSTISLKPELLKIIYDYDFSRITRVNLDDLLDDPDVKKVLYEWFGADPGPAPLGVTPSAVQKEEMLYIGQLLEAYSEHSGKPMADHSEAAMHAAYGSHLSRQRERFYDADSFKRFYRDNTEPGLIETFENDIYHGVIDVCESEQPNALNRVDKVMSQASAIQPSGILGNHSRVQTRQGICHHFANEEKPRLKWRKL